MSKFNDLSGKTFGSWTVMCVDRSYDGKHRRWICKCKCGTIKSVIGYSLTNGRSKSCGCRKIIHKGINSTHGLSKTRLYHEWTSMKRRCLPGTQNSKTYSNRGITVCKEWDSDFMLFYKWAIQNGYNDSLSLDRIDNDKGYSPQNCRWIPIQDQQSNKSNTIRINYNGKEYCLRTLCKKIEFPYKTAHHRLQRMRKKGEDIDIEKLFAPIQKNKISFRFRTNS